MADKNKNQEPVGLLFSQVGYDAGRLKKIYVRGPEKFFSADMDIVLEDAVGKAVWKGRLSEYGRHWSTNWRTADFTAFNTPGEYAVLLKRGGKTILKDSGLKIGKSILFDSCAKSVAIEALKRREIFAEVKPGWYDAGQLWQEVGSHSVMIYGLCDLYMKSGRLLKQADKKALLTRVKNGCDYLALCNDDAVKKGKGRGALTHDLVKMRGCFTPNDSFLAALSFAKSAEVFLKNRNKAMAEKYARRASVILDWLYYDAVPLEVPRNHPYNQGFLNKEKYPREWMTRFLMIELWAEIILNSIGLRKTGQIIDSLTSKVLKRQIKISCAENGLWGHFYAYDSSDVSEKAWSHGMPVRKKEDKEIPFGSDMQCTMAHPVFCFTEGVRRLPGNKNAAKWKQAVLDFAEYYFKPACLSGPFKILPRGVFGKEGLLWFAGLWHGTNTIYGQAAGLACEFYKMTNDKAYVEIASANLQWICGLNAGLTNQAIGEGCVVYTASLPEGRAIPISMIQGIGSRFAGNWTTISGSICNGFGAGRQFVYDVPPARKYDSPSALHDEDWITHSGGFLMGLAAWAEVS